jgi:3-hydroxyisobutyrate dehydrogenase
MARRLLAAGFPLAVYNRNPEKPAALETAGARIAPSPAEAAAQADIVFSMVADDVASRGIWLGEKGALQKAKPGAVLVESSTLSIGWVKELAAAAEARGCELLDAPVTGSKAQAASGELRFLVGGPATALETARPAFGAIGQAVVHLGPSGSGALMKLINNFVCAVQMTSLAEALALIDRGGLKRDQALEVLKTGAPGSPMLRVMSERMTARDYTPNFFLRLLAKDVGYAIAEGERHSLKLTTAASALELLKQAIAAGYGDKDMSAVFEQVRSDM